MKKTVLVVDDIESIRFAIAEFLSAEFSALEAADGYAALEACSGKQVDLVITDIRMPGMGGLALIKRLSAEYPHMKFALMTAYNPDDYIRFARVERVWNIIPKSTALDLNHIRTMAHKLLGDEIFGVQQYFPKARSETAQLADVHRMHRKLPEEGLAHDVFYICRVSSAGESNSVCDKAGDLLTASGAPSVVRMVLEELAANAMIHAPGGDRPGPDPAMTPENYPMRSEDAFDICFGMLGRNAVVGVTDYKGSLDREAILSRLERHTTLDSESGLPVGLTDAHGRGLYISRENADHLVFNIEPGRRTEILGFFPVDASIRTRAISIFQKEEK
ncbi:MAG: response regulator [Leptospirales bacterium]|nr:response regulator [Leptospirales bacterium]